MGEVSHRGRHAGNGAQRIAMERIRQRRVKGYDAAHDKGHAEELAAAGAIYATIPEERPYATWPWSSDAWRPTPDDRVRELEKAGALIAAAIDALLAEEPEAGDDT